MDEMLSGWWTLNKSNLSLTKDYWWWPYIAALMTRMDGVRQMSYLHPDGLLPPKSDWMDDDKIKAWEKLCDKLREDKRSQEGWTGREGYI